MPTVISVGVLGVLAVVALLRFAQLDNWVGGAILSAAAPALFLAAYPTLVVTVWLRRWALIVGAFVAVAIHLWWFYAMLPLVHADRGLRSGAVRVRVMTANLLVSNTSAAKLGPIIDAQHPDILALEEFSTVTAPRLRSSGALDAFGYRLVDVLGSPSGIALYSRLPIRHAQVISAAGRPVIRAVVETGNGPITVYAVHTVAPVDSSSEASWNRQLHTLATLFARERGPLVVAGDFNATDGNRPFATLMDRGSLADVLDATGKGYATTWPQNHHLLPALVRPDHVLVGRGLKPLRGRTLDNPGSDHRAVVVDVGVPHP